MASDITHPIVRFEEGIQRAKTYGICMISVIHSSHLGALGSYVEEAANEGFLAFGFSNTDTLVLPHGSKKALSWHKPRSHSQHH